MNEETNANDRQIAGTHYQSAIQHWDYVIANDLDYFQAQITKYVTRWKKKGGITDLQKAQHFLQKYIEAVRSGAYKEFKVAPAAVTASVVPAERVKEWQGYTFEGAKDGLFEFSCHACRTHVWVPEHTDPLTAHGECARARGYVEQDQFNVLT